MRCLLTILLVLSTTFGDGATAAAAGPKTTSNPRYDAAVVKALDWLKQSVTTAHPEGGHAVLAAYAMFKCGEPITQPFVATTIAASVARSANTQYSPVNAYDHIYGAGIDAMFLADVNADIYKPNLQVIADYITSVQRSDGSWSNGPQEPGDVSMSQYGVLGLWAAQRAGCNVSPGAIDRGAAFLLTHGNSDGGWGYRPGTTAGPGAGNSTHNMTVAAAGTLLVARLMLHGPKNAKPKSPEETEKKFGLLEKVDPLADVLTPGGSAFPNYRAENAASSIDQRAERGLAWNEVRFEPVSRVEHNLYFYYCIERAASIGDLKTIAGRDWFTAYGDGLLTLQSPDGSFATHTGSVVGTSFALLYFMRSTKQILDKQYGLGLQKSNKGNPFGDKKNEREPTALDQLLTSMEKIDFSDPSLDADVDVASELVRSVQSIDDPEVLVGQIDRLKGLVDHPSAEVRQPVYWALGRTGEFSLVPLLLKGLRDPNVDVNVEADRALRYIARKPSGIGVADSPLTGAETGSDEERVRVANQWRTKAWRAWSQWYSERRPFEDQDGLDELVSGSTAK